MLTGTLANACAIFLCSIIGVLFGHLFNENFKRTLSQATGIVVLVIGMQMALMVTDILALLLCIVLGAAIGEFCKIELYLEKFGLYASKLFHSEKTNFVEGFITASITFCIGSMAIIGAIEEGVNGNPKIFFMKAILDGVTSFVFAASLGIGVAFSAFFVLIYQGSLSLFSFYIKDFFTINVMDQLSAVGGVMILSIGLNILLQTFMPKGKLIKIPLGNFFPALILSILYSVYFADKF